MSGKTAQIRYALILLISAVLLGGCDVLELVNPTPTPTATSKPTQTEVPPTATPETTDTGRYQETGDYFHEIEVGGVKRWFLVHLPPGFQPGEPIPLVINIHGRTATAFDQEELSQMNAKADKEGFVVVNPQALDDPPTWWGAIPAEIGDPDLAFFKLMIEELQREISIDPKRIYATGMSNGGSMSTRLGCDLSDVIAAVAPVSGGHVLRERCKPTRPVPMVVFHGLEDTIIPYEGRQGPVEGDRLPAVYEWVEDWATRNECEGDGIESVLVDNVTVREWTNCPGDGEVLFYSIADAGHTWPGSGFGEYMGGTSDEVNATDLIWAFFIAHPMP